MKTSNISLPVVWCCGALAILSLLLSAHTIVAGDVPEILPASDGKPAEQTKTVKVYVMLGQSNMLGFGRVEPQDLKGTLEYFVRTKSMYPHLVDSAGKWITRQDVGYVHVMDQRGVDYRDLETFGVIRNEWLVPNKSFGPELGFGQVMGYYHDEPVLLLKACIGNRSLGWDFLPPGSERFEHDGKVYARYKDVANFWDKGSEPKPVPWYAGRQYDADVAHAKAVLNKLGDYYSMKSSINIALLSITLLIPTVSKLRAQEKLERGKDRIDTQAIGTGLCVHNLFQSNMVVQREKSIPIWGWADPNEKITVTFANDTRSCMVAADRSWKVELPAMSASSESRTITIQGNHETIELTNILIGDVWLLAGQSNMEFEIHKLEEGPLEIVSANFDQIRLFTVPQQNGPETKTSFPRLYQWNDFFSRHFRQGYWDVCSPETVPDMSGIGYIFGRRIHLATRVPIGLVDVSRGGTTLMSWTPIEELRKIDTPEVVSGLAEWDKKVAEFDAQKDLELRIKRFNEQTSKLKAQGNLFRPIAFRQPICSRDRQPT